MGYAKSRKRHKIIGRAPISKNNINEYNEQAFLDYQDMPFVDALMLSKSVDDETKQEIQKCTVIDGTSVSDYFYMETDQEYWSPEKDFPNIAPPFESFFLQFDAPSKIVSKVTGIRDWSPSMPRKWGLLCRGLKVIDAYNSTSDGEKQEKIEKSIKQSEFMVNEIVKKHWPKGGIHDELSAKRFYDSLPKQYQQMIFEHKAWKYYLEHENELKSSIDAHIGEWPYWKLEMTLFWQIERTTPDGTVIGIPGPVFGFDTPVNKDGSVFLYNGSPHIKYYALEHMQNHILNASKRQNIPIPDVLELIKNGVAPLFDIGLLTLSFLHCKNVQLTKEEKRCYHKINSNQKDIDYHTLDIKPMKEVLRKEGKSEETGIKKALHICRGHFRHYEEGRGLFGKYSGTFWVPQHVRGNKEYGQIMKNYNIEV
jgi:hypothetical protein